MAHVRFAAAGAAQDAQLVHAARAGDYVSLGALFERYRAPLYALALSILGHRAEAEDAVHDTFLTALARLSELSDPAAVGGWLHATLRSRCLMALRTRKRRAEVREADAPLDEIPDEARIEDRIESRQLRDWVWGALRQLPEPIRVAMLLRYFGSYESYDELSAILGIPVGTVRSRLFDGRARLADLLLSRAGITEPAQRALEQERHAFILESFAELARSGPCDRFLSVYSSDVEINWSGKRITHGRQHLQAEIEGDFEVGVVLAPQRVLASAGVTIVEGLFRNPPEDPNHCPPGVALVHFHDDTQVARMQLHLSPRPPQAGDA